MNRNNEVTLIVADAFVMYYDNILTKWIGSGISKSVTIAKVQLLQNVISNQFRIFACNPINKEVLVNSVLYHNLRYQKAHATFHEWRDADTQMVYGLHFADSKDASFFGDVISKVFKSLESIYIQCRELQSQIKSTSVIDQCNKPLPNIDQSKFIQNNLVNLENPENVRMLEYSTNNSPKPKEEICHYSQVNRSSVISVVKSLDIVDTRHNFLDSNSETEAQSPHNYENIDSILLKHVAMKSVVQENIELSNKCQSSSDDSVRGLTRQPSSTSSGYATVASMTEQYSPTPGLTSSFSVVAEVLNKCISDSKIKNQNSSDCSTGLVCQNEASVTDNTSSSFTGQVQGMIQSRKLNQTSLRNESSHLNLHPYNLKSDIRQLNFEQISVNTTILKESQPCFDSKSISNSKVIPAEDIMSEMKLKLQRRKLLIEGHTDPNYSSSTDKSDVCSSSASDNGSFSINIDKTIDKKISPQNIMPNPEGYNSKIRISEVSSSNMLLLQEEDNFSSFSEDFKDLSCKKKMSTGDIIQSSTSSTISATKQDLERIKREITDDLRRELMEAKREILVAIRLLKT